MGGCFGVNSLKDLLNSNNGTIYAVSTAAMTHKPLAMRFDGNDVVLHNITFFKCSCPLTW